jgi:preprotein translocase subunit SecD
MLRTTCLLAVLFLAGCQPAQGPRQARPAATDTLSDGVYAVLRDGLQEKEMLPLADGEALVVHRHRYLKTDKDEPPRYVVVRATPDVTLDLAGEPAAVKEDGEVSRILLKLRPGAAAALERLTRERQGRQIAIVLGGEVVTMHKVREVIKGGDVQISSCAPGAAGYLLERLWAHQGKE